MRGRAGPAPPADLPRKSETVGPLHPSRVSLLLWPRALRLLRSSIRAYAPAPCPALPGLLCSIHVFAGSVLDLPLRRTAIVEAPARARNPNSGPQLTTAAPEFLWQCK